MRAQIEEADAVLILSDLSAEKPETQDARNLLRLIAVKSRHPEIPCLVQLIQFQSTVCRATPRPAYWPRRTHY